MSVGPDIRTASKMRSTPRAAHYVRSARSEIPVGLWSKIFVPIFCYISAVVGIGAAAFDAMNQPPAPPTAAAFGGAGAIFLVTAIALTRYRSKVLCERGPS
jgi:hypothetical protein